MVKFKCKRSGNIVTVVNEQDILSIRKNESYQEIKDETQNVAKTNEADDGKEHEKSDVNNSCEGKSSKRQEKVLKKRGRPSSK